MNVFSTVELYLEDRQGSNAICGDKTVISDLQWYASDWHRLLITVGGVGCVVSVVTSVKWGAVYHDTGRRPLAQPTQL